MKLLIHDLGEKEFQTLFSQIGEDIIVIADNAAIRPCIGCFGCWVKTPGTCVIKDGYEDLGKLLSGCDEMIVISKCLYGGFSSFVKNVLDRGIAYIHPYFTRRNGEMHHRKRYDSKVKWTVFFYGEDITPDERKTAEMLIPANGVNFNSRESSVRFYNNYKEIRGDFQ